MIPATKTFLPSTGEYLKQWPRGYVCECGYQHENKILDISDDEYSKYADAGVAIVRADCPVANLFTKTTLFINDRFAVIQE